MSLATASRLLQRSAKTIKSSSREGVQRKASGRGVSAAKVAQSLAPMVRRFLIQNLSASGIKSRSGELRDMVSKARVIYDARRSILRITPPQNPTIRSSESRNQAFAKLESLNSGWVASDNNLSKKTKNTVKRAAKKAKSNKSSGLTVVQGRGFFKLTAAQKSKVQAEFSRRLAQARKQRAA